MKIIISYCLYTFLNLEFYLDGIDKSVFELCVRTEQLRFDKINHREVFSQVVLKRSP